jgi:glucose/mannose-6-phosphate isomerase
MLDDLKRIHELDTQDALGIAEKEGAQLTHDFALSGRAFNGVQNVVYGAMGGSALAATLVRTWPTLHLPFEIVRDYDIPAYVDGKTLFIAASYSGNTEETLSALEQAEAKGAQIAVIASGGTLQRIAEEKGYMFARLPKAEQPRFAVLYNFRALLEILTIAGLLQDDFRPQLATTAEFLGTAARAWRPDVPTANNPAKQIAQELIGKSIVVYSGPKLAPAAYKWKISFNENAKQVAWTNQLPEFNHNEFIGWSKQPVDKPYALIDLRSNLEHPRVQKRFVVTERLLSGMRPSPIVVQAAGTTLLEQLLWIILFGDFVSVYLALLNGLNPAPVELVEKFKRELNG